jgi:hypothetical protein
MALVIDLPSLTEPDRDVNDNELKKRLAGSGQIKPNPTVRVSDHWGAFRPDLQTWLFEDILMRGLEQRACWQAAVRDCDPCHARC